MEAWGAGAPGSRLVRRAAALTLGALLLVASSALAAGHFVSGALYTARSCQAAPPGATCVYKFRASSNGSTLRFVGATVVSVWRCRGGGGEALLGGKHAFADPIPVLTVRPNGAIRGTATMKTQKIIVTGTLSKSGAAATITFHLGNECVGPPVTLRRV